MRVRPRTPRLRQYCTAIFKRDFDGDRAGIAEEHAIEIRRRQHRREPARQRQRRLMHHAAEHHVRHLRELTLDRGADMRMVVAVAGGPPRGDAVDQLAPVGQHDAAAVRCRDRKRRGRGLHLRIRQPDMVEAGRIPIRLRGPAYPLVFAGIARHSALSCRLKAPLCLPAWPRSRSFARSARCRGSRDALAR